MSGGKSSVIKESLMLLHSDISGDIIILNPSTKRVEKEDGVLVSSLDELFSGVLKEEAVTVVEGVSNLEGIDSISSELDGLVLDLSGGESEVVHSIVELDSLSVDGSLGSNKPVSLSHNSFGLDVLGREGSEGSGADLFLSVGEEDGLFEDGNNLVSENGGAFESDLSFSLKGFVLLGGDGKSDGN